MWIAWARPMPLAGQHLDASPRARRVTDGSLLELVRPMELHTIGSLRRARSRQRVVDLSKETDARRPTCCRRRSPQFVRFEPGRTALLKPSSVRLLVVLATDSTNATRALTLSNIAAFSQLNQVRASFVVVVGRCGKWASVAAGAAALGVPFDCVCGRQSHPLHPQKMAVARPFVRNCRCSSTAR